MTSVVVLSSQVGILIVGSFVLGILADRIWLYFRKSR